MDLGQIFIWIIVGAIAGLLADAVVKGIRIGFLGAIIVGIVGGFLGGWLLGLLNINLGAGILGDILTAFIGAVILLFLLRAIRGR